MTDKSKLRQLAFVAGYRKAVPRPEYAQIDMSAFAVIPCGYPVKVYPQQDRYEEERVHFVRG